MKFHPRLGHRRVRLAAAALGVSALVLSGCATNSDDGGSDDSGDGGGKVTLRFQSLAFQEPTVKATKQIVDDWNADNPDIQVQYVQGSWDSVHDQLVTQFQGSTAPDIIHDESADIAGFAEQGYLADLSPYLSDDVKSDVPQGVWDTVTNDDKIVAAPTLLQSYMVFANTDMLEAAGVTVPTGDTWSWDDFRDAAQATTTGGTYGVGWGLAEPTSTMLSLGMNYGAKYFDGTGQDAEISIGDAEMAVPETIHAMAYDDKSIDPTSLTLSGGDTLPGFLHGKYAMTVQGSYAAQSIVETAPKNFHWAVLPALSADSAEQAANPQTLSVAAESPHVEEATEFINYYMEAKNLAAVAEGDWLIPSSASASEQVQTDTGGDNGWDQILQSGTTLTQAPFQSVTNYPQWKDQIATPAYQEYFGDKISADDLQSKLTDGWSSVGGG